MNIFRNLVYHLDLRLIHLRKCKHKFETASKKLEEMIRAG